jgi:hypothetical protein
LPGSGQPHTKALDVNSIPDTQNSDRALCLLRARQRTYALATTLQVVQLLTAVVLPTVLAIFAIMASNAETARDVRAGLATASLGCLLLDIVILDRALGFFLRRAAKIAEQFDCEVLQLPWNGFISDRKVDHEDIVAAAEAYPKTEKAAAALRDWYPVSVRRAPLHVARIACQLANIRYDVKLRRRYGIALFVPPLLVLIAFVVASLNLDFPDVVLSILVPATPAIVWTLREFFRHFDAAAAQERIKGAIETVWTGINARAAEECTLKAREIQDAIYLRRVSSPLIFPLVYHFMRDKMEDQMNKGADERLSDAGYPADAAS